MIEPLESHASYSVSERRLLAHNASTRLRVRHAGGLLAAFPNRGAA